MFVSPRFLFPADQGGKIRTTQILKGMKGGRFEIVLASPEGNGDAREYAGELAQICDRFIGWPQAEPGPLHHITRLRHLVSSLPVSVISEDAARGREAVDRALSDGVDLVVFDFLHAMVLAPDTLGCRSLMFTHNVEAEIFARHAAVTRNPLKRAVWQQQYRKMRAYEHESLKRFDTVVAVSERDAATFRALDGMGRVEPIPTGVDLEFFACRPPGDDDHIVFTGAMDWQANIDGIGFFMDEIWPRVVARRPRAHVTIVGRNPAPALVDRARRRELPFTFTGFVDDIRTHVADAAAYIIPLRVGGGTRIKAFEAMAMGIPVVSTGLGVEGLSITPDTHYLHADTAVDFAHALVRLLEDGDLRQRLSQQARSYVESHCSAQAVARRFEDICWQTLQGAGSV
ncbi:MAG: glycosyltransferase [Ectothiorhodospira sp.]